MTFLCQVEAPIWQVSPAPAIYQSNFKFHRTLSSNQMVFSLVKLRHEPSVVKIPNIDPPLEEAHFWGPYGPQHRAPIPLGLDKPLQDAIAELLPAEELAQTLPARAESGYNSWLQTHIRRACATPQAAVQRAQKSGPVKNNS